jgi:hypothetical protein
MELSVFLYQYTDKDKYMRLRFLSGVIALLAVMEGCSKNEYTPKLPVEVNTAGPPVNFQLVNLGDFGIYEIVSYTGGAVEEANASVKAGGTGDVGVYTGSAFQNGK